MTQSPVYRSLPITYIFAAVKDETILSNKTDNGFPDLPTRLRSPLPDKRISSLYNHNSRHSASRSISTGAITDESVLRFSVTHCLEQQLNATAV